MGALEQLFELLKQVRAGKIGIEEYRVRFDQLNRQMPAEDRLAAVNYSPALIQQQITAGNMAEFDQNLQGLYGVLQGTVDLVQLANSFNQIRNAREAARNTPTPAFPTPPGPNPALSQALFDAQGMVGDIGYAVDPATQQLNLGYNQAVQQAQAATGGQAANMQALTSLANFQRMQGALGLVPVAQQARMQNQGLVNDLISARMQEQQNQFQNQMGVADLNFDLFNRRQQAIAALGSQGRSYAFDAISRIPDYLQYLPFDEDDSNYIRDSFKRSQALEASKWGANNANVVNDFSSQELPGMNFKGY
jgi:hypothetical protein